ncbi:MAG: uroporphyrinogen-III C-methyltransferase [Myxococcales bacterium]|nr:uroporphyrinogen-III C-methyltransferase [Myxococcales bacterium]
MHKGGRGAVWLIGAGPGEPDLITVRGRELLGRADVVLYDALSHPGLLEWCRPEAERRNVGKRYGQRSPDQSWITSQLIELARAGKCVARLKGGDPLLFARGAEEAEALAEAGIRFEIVPGISSPVATTAYAGISMTHRDLSSSVTFITGSDREGKQWSDAAWKKLATATDTICVLMGMRRIEEITRAIVDGGRRRETPTSVIQWGARPQQRVVEGTLGDIAERVRQAGVTNPAIIVVGEVTQLRSKLAWYDSRPLFGQRVLVPRPVAQAQTSAAAIRERAAQPVILPLIRIEAPPEPARLERAVTELERYDWVLFTSANGVVRCADELERVGRDARAFGAAKVACIGPKTAQALARLGIRADLVAKEYVGEGLAQELAARGVGKGSRVLLLRALEAREALPDLLVQAGASVDVVPAYQTLKLDEAGRAELRGTLGVADPERRSIDVALFTSSSTAHSFADALGDTRDQLPPELVLASIGPVTSATLRERGLRVDVEAEVYTVDGLLDALEAHFVSRPGPT